MPKNDYYYKASDVKFGAKPSISTIDQDVYVVNSLVVKQLFGYLKESLSEFYPTIANVRILHNLSKIVYISHSHTPIKKAYQLLGYQPYYN